MSQERIVQTVISVLIMAGYQVSERCGIRPRSFDIIARKDAKLLVIKVVPHIDSVGEESAHDLALIAQHLDATPFIVGDKARESELERGAVYIRHGIIATNSKTLYDFLVDDVPPLVFAQPGGLYVNINGGKLRELRERRNLSLGDLASALGVSRRTISKYESGMSTTLDIAIRLEELFDAAIVEAIDILKKASDLKTRPDSKEPEDNSPPDFRRIGIESHTMCRAPFNALAVFEEKTILTGYGTTSRTIRHAGLIGNISEITESGAVCILTDYKKKKRIGKTLIIGEDVLSDLTRGSEFIELIEEQ
ncbi:MAG: transcriptional regulator [Methanomicrobiaceae archaeon]|nr:transcriptional regulator [Methanomicrobiaceae archaeon]